MESRSFFFFFVAQLSPNFGYLEIIHASRSLTASLPLKAMMVGRRFFPFRMVTCQGRAVELRGCIILSQKGFVCWLLSGFFNSVFFSPKDFSVNNPYKL